MAHCDGCSIEQSLDTTRRKELARVLTSRRISRAVTLCLFLVAGLVVVYGATYLWQPEEKFLWGPYSITGELPGENGNPIGTLGLYLTTNTLFSVSNTVNVKATFRPLDSAFVEQYIGPLNASGYTYQVFFLNTTTLSASGTLSNSSGLPSFGNITLALDRSTGIYSGQGSFEWQTPGLHGAQIRLVVYAANRSYAIGPIGADNHIIYVSTEEAFQSARTNDLIVGLTIILLGMAIIQAYDVVASHVWRKE